VPQGFPQDEIKRRCDELATLMDQLDIHDIGCCKNDPRCQIDPKSRMCNTKAPLKAISIYNDLDIEVKVVFIPPGSRIPLHDHPGMNVF